MGREWQNSRRVLDPVLVDHELQGLGQIALQSWQDFKRCPGIKRHFKLHPFIQCVSLLTMKVLPGHLHHAWVFTVDKYNLLLVDDCQILH